VIDLQKQRMLDILEERNVKAQKGQPKQNRPGDVIKTITINNREATTTKGARAILKERTGRDYSRDAVYRLYVNGKIEGVRTDIANLYYIDSLKTVVLSPEVGRNATYSPETREQALLLHDQGLTNREVAEKVGATNQIVNYWIQKRIT
jgi:transposase